MLQNKVFNFLRTSFWGAEFFLYLWRLVVRSIDISSKKEYN